MPLGLYPNTVNQGSFIKPRGRLILNQDHPLVQPKAGLLLAWAASESEGFRIRDLAQGYPEIIPGSSTHAKWTSGRGMPALDFTGGAKEVRFVRKAGLPTIADVISPITMLSIIYPTANSGQIVSCPLSTANLNHPAQGMGIGSTGFLVLEEASSPNETSTLAVPLNTWHVVGISQTGASARTYMVDGKTATGSTTITSAAVSNTDPFCLGRYYLNNAAVTADDYHGFIELVLVWNTALTVPQLKSFASNPYQIFGSQINRIAYSFGAQPVAATATPINGVVVYPNEESLLRLLLERPVIESSVVIPVPFVQPPPPKVADPHEQPALQFLLEGKSAKASGAAVGQVPPGQVIVDEKPFLQMLLKVLDGSAKWFSGVVPVPFVKPSPPIVASDRPTENLAALPNSMLDGKVIIFSGVVPVPFVKPPPPVIAEAMDRLGQNLAVESQSMMLDGKVISFSGVIPVPIIQPGKPVIAADTETPVKLALLQGSAFNFYPYGIVTAVAAPTPIRAVVIEDFSLFPIEGSARSSSARAPNVPLRAIVVQDFSFFPPEGMVRSSSAIAPIPPGKPVIVADNSYFQLEGAVRLYRAIIPVPIVQPAKLYVASESETPIKLALMPGSAFNFYPFGITLVPPPPPIVIFVRPTLKLAVADNGNGTVTATITGSGGSSVNKIYTQPADSTVRQPNFLFQGSRIGDGKFTFSMAPGFYWGMATSNSMLTIAPLVMFGATNSAALLTDVDEQCIKAVVSRLQGMVFAGTSASPPGIDPILGITDCLVPIDELLTTPCLMVSTEGDSENIGGMTNLRDDFSFPVKVTLVDQNDMPSLSQQRIRRAKYTKWREQIARAFTRQRLGGVPDIFDCYVTMGNICDPKLWQQQYFISGMTLRFSDRLTRGTSFAQVDSGFTFGAS